MRDRFVGLGLLERLEPQSVCGDVGSYAINPGGEFRIFLEIGKATANPHKHFLRQILRLASSDESRQITEDSRPIGIMDRLEVIRETVHMSTLNPILVSVTLI